MYRNESLRALKSNLTEPDKESLEYMHRMKELTKEEEEIEQICPKHNKVRRLSSGSGTSKFLRTSWRSNKIRNINEALDKITEGLITALINSREDTDVWVPDQGNRGSLSKSYSPRRADQLKCFLSMYVRFKHKDETTSHIAILKTETRDLLPPFTLNTTPYQRYLKRYMNGWRQGLEEKVEKGWVQTETNRFWAIALKILQ